MCRCKDINATVDQQPDRFGNSFVCGVMQCRRIIPDDPDTATTAAPRNACFQVGSVIDQQLHDFREANGFLNDRITGAALEVIYIDFELLDEKNTQADTSE